MDENTDVLMLKEFWTRNATAKIQQVQYMLKRSGDSRGNRKEATIAYLVDLGYEHFTQSEFFEQFKMEVIE